VFQNTIAYSPPPTASSFRKEYQPWIPVIQDGSIDLGYRYDLMVLPGVSIVLRSFCRWTIWGEFGVLWLP
jgi:hypothetical protein